MENTDILIILLSVGMSVVLLFVIIALFYAIKILKSLQKISDKAEHVADNVDAASAFFRKTAGPAAIAKLLANIVESVRNKK